MKAKTNMIFNDNGKQRFIRCGEEIVVGVNISQEKFNKFFGEQNIVDLVKKPKQRGRKPKIKRELKK